MSETSTTGHLPTAPGLVRAIERQLATRDELLRGGARQVGWKLGMGERESIGGEIAVGYLTSATELEPGGTFAAAGAEALHADAEIAIEIGASGIAGLRPALEIVDLDGPDDPEEVVAGNVFHRGVAFGPLATELPAGAHGALAVNGKERSRGDAPPPEELERRIERATRVLSDVGERLLPGSFIITGNIVQTPVRSGDEVSADRGRLGRVALRISG